MPVPYDRAERPPHPSHPGDGDPNGPSSNTNGSVAGTYFLGRYRVVDEIGIGGMASVHLARMDGPGGFQKWVAIKRIHPHLVEDDSFVHMFLDEARIAARISHPNVASVFELGKHEDTYWIAMEYLHGEPLREVMRRTEEMGQPMPPEIACRVIADAAEGLHAAHELMGKNGEKLQLVHRDVTPHNLFVTYDGTTKVVDFGIAKFSSRMASTRAGTLKGKLAYMSPEQVAGEAIDRRTDLFALGVVLWELTTGQRLFRMESDLDTLAKVQECNVPRPSQVVRGYPIDLEKIVMKALAKNKNERYKTAREFSRALQSLLMRRGLFIASDEVASYVQAIFVDRIRKRDEHLRWAAEVTQTINIDSKLEAAAPAASGSGGSWANEPSLVTFNSEVQPSPQPARGVPRPAAGAPAPAPQLSQASFAQTFSNPSATTNPRPGAAPLPAPGAAKLADTLRPPGRPGAADPQAARAPAMNLASTQATAAAVPKSKAPQAASAPPHPALDEPPTIRASPRAREEMLEMAMAAATTSPRARVTPPPPPPVAEASVPDLANIDDYDDTDDTIVTSTRPDFSQAAPERPSAPIPAAGRPAPALRPLTRSTPPPPPASPGGGAFSAPPRSVPPRVPTAPQLPAVVVPPAAGAIEVGPQGNLDDTRTAIGESAFSQPRIQRSGSMSGELPDPLATARAHAAVEVGQLFAPPPRAAQRTITSAALRRYNVPLWAVAAGSALLALVTFGILLLIVTRVGGNNDPGKASATGVGSAAPPSAATAAPPNGRGPNPFSTARQTFDQKFPRPTSDATPATPPTGASPGVDTRTAQANAQPSDGTSAGAPKPALAAATNAKPPSTGTPSATTSSDPDGTFYGTLTVMCSPTCDSVLDNGSSLGPSPVVQRKVAVGPRRVTLSWGGGKRKMLSAIVVADQDARVVASWP